MAKLKKLPKNDEEKGIVKENYCRMCMKMLPVKDFYLSTDPLDKSGFMSVCKDHCNEIYNTSLTMERNFEKALLRSCRMLNIAYAPSAIDAAKTHVAKFADSGKKDIQVFGIYKSKLTSISRLSDNADLTFYGFDNNPTLKISDKVTDDEDFNKYLEIFWGPGLPFDDYEFLESTLAWYEETHESNTASQKSLLKQICFAELDIRKARMGGGTPSQQLITGLQNLMKTASVDPSKASLAANAKSRGLVSSFISIMEENDPADYFEDKKMFKDFDDLGPYLKNYLTRPTKNFILQSRDFNIEAEDDIEIEEPENGDIAQTL